MSQVTHLLHSLDPQTGGVFSAVQLLSNSINKLGVVSNLSDDPNYSPGKDEVVIAHGLWQWPGRRARALQSPYLLFPHGMLDPWFKQTYLWKHSNWESNGRQPALIASNTLNPKVSPFSASEG